MPTAASRVEAIRLTTRHTSLAVVSLLAALMTAGCATLELDSHAAPGATAVHPTVLVLPLREDPDEYGVGDYTLFGGTGPQGSGELIRRTVAASLKEYFSLVPPDALRLAMVRRGIKISDLPLMSDDAARELARELKADLLVRGEVKTCRTAWILFIPRSRVAFSLRAIWTENGREWWRARFEDASFISPEQRLAAEGARRIVRRLARRHSWPPKAPAR